MMITISPLAHALRPFRMDVRRNEFINFTATTFPKNPQAGCEMYLRRAEIFGLIEDGDGPRGIDVLDCEGDILQTFTATPQAFNYLRHKLKFRREAHREG